MFDREDPNDTDPLSTANRQRREVAAARVQPNGSTNGVSKAHPVRTDVESEVLEQLRIDKKVCGDRSLKYQRESDKNGKTSTASMPKSNISEDTVKLAAIMGQCLDDPLRKLENDAEVTSDDLRSSKSEPKD